ncbi:Phosphoserine aminotransferase [Hyphomicrobium sulfonivorans]|uniref:phosphoserine transaminase n=1 Tax=Hyphomicrobium sulfonivorans TaxID=121290 RepID=A0A109B8H4_HYPSL|nr:phosphoserine transaminase [Hyphomicrobium sulfonivorans]KWT64159.1 Phosphoserine aminotransferase [Hyphomicrobium sulfonivorans]
MDGLSKPTLRPANPHFSSGPCSKRPGWSLDALSGALVGRSHRSPVGKQRLKLVIDKTHALLQLPHDYRVAIVPGSDTGAFEMALWNLLGARGVDVLAWEDFGHRWVRDIIAELRIADARVLAADYGHLPDLAAVDFDRDVILPWNGTAAGVRVPDGAWIAADRKGLIIVDATSALFAQRIDWAKVDVATFSWQKILGGEAAHGMIVLSPRAIERLQNHRPSWPVPKLFRLTEGGKLQHDIFAGVTINTPSMLCVEDYLDTLAWADSVGGLDALCARADATAAVLFDWIARTPWIANLAVDPATRSNTSVCMRFTDAGEGPGAEQRITDGIVSLLESEGVAYDIGAYRGAPAGLRVWCGATVERSDVEALIPWLEWAYAQVRGTD